MDAAVNQGSVKGVETYGGLENTPAIDTGDREGVWREGSAERRGNVGDVRPRLRDPYTRLCEDGAL